jgi:hypothetical protein
MLGGGCRRGWLGEEDVMADVTWFLKIGYDRLAGELTGLARTGRTDLAVLAGGPSDWSTATGAKLE